ncbi:MAG: dihydroorotate dehydrogenase-like protein [Pirellulaceae bacterium]
MTFCMKTTYLGLELSSPLVASAGPTTRTLDGLRLLEQSGAAAAVLPSLFEEQIEHEQLALHRLYEYQAESYAESLSYFPTMPMYGVGPDEYLKYLEEAKSAVRMPLIASLNGASPGGWMRYARNMQDAGADALELNIYYVPTDPSESAAEVERRYAEMVNNVSVTVDIPLAVKLGPSFTALPHFAQQLASAGADGLVLFNRYLEPNIDLDSLQIVPDLELSSRHEIRPSLRWIAILRDTVTVSLAATSGAHMAEDVVKLLLVGADVVMMTSALLKFGAQHLKKVDEDLREWCVQREYRSIDQLRGSMSRANCPDASALERGNYMKALQSYTA